MTNKPTREELAALTQALTDKGLLIEAGFKSLCMMALPADVPAAQLDALRTFFFAGAHHTFSSVMAMFEEADDDNVTADDLRRMNLINQELVVFLEGFKKRYRV